MTGYRSKTGGGGFTASKTQAFLGLGLLCGGLLFLTPSADARNTGFTLGTHDYSELEFDCDYNYLREYTVGTDLKLFPKEINATWWPYQIINFRHDGTQNRCGVSVRSMWTDGVGSLRTRVMLARTPPPGSTNLPSGLTLESSFKGQSLLDFNSINYYAPELDQPGDYQLHLIALYGENGTSIAVWDDLALYEFMYTATPTTNFNIGTANNSEMEFDTDYVYNTYYNADTQPVSQFPKEINRNWYPTQTIGFTWYSPSSQQRAFVLSASHKWMDGSSKSSMNVDVFLNGAYVGSLLMVNDRSLAGNSILISNPNEGYNEITLQARQSSLAAPYTQATIVVWDYLSFTRAP